MHLLITESLIFFFGLALGGSLVAIYLRARQWEKQYAQLLETVRNMTNLITELRDQVKGKRLGYHLANAVEDLTAEEVAEDAELLNIQLHQQEIDNRIGAIVRSKQTRMNVLHALRSGKYDPSLPANKQAR